MFSWGAVLLSLLLNALGKGQDRSVKVFLVGYSLVCLLLSARVEILGYGLQKFYICIAVSEGEKAVPWTCRYIIALRNLGKNCTSYYKAAHILFYSLKWSGGWTRLQALPTELLLFYPILFQNNCNNQCLVAIYSVMCATEDIINLFSLFFCFTTTAELWKNSKSVLLWSAK